jgi:hypothetical protein
MQGVDRKLVHPSTTVGPGYKVPDWRDHRRQQVLAELRALVDQAVAQGA